MSMRDRWQNRRRMAWAALAAGLAYPLLLLVGTNAEQLGPISGPFYLFVGSVVGAYIGFATVDDKWQSNSQPGASPASFEGPPRYAQYPDPDFRHPDGRPTGGA